eukprot:CAMPEP_0180103272 /NCGR_PEP_ID=MMETSP0985-20121206/30682_1 /TAXON_ID=483367 /ORGANISM="non described non described, Strain CCMP 2436" /LENGTH=169 /DNA_ID=CAMNT_0022039741 /DNA_START=173 /DNA_END=683 /DNA_ORIENTATION=+
MAGPLRHGLVRLPLVRTRRRQRNRSAPAATSALLASRFRLAAPGVASRARTTSARPRVRRPLRRGGDGYYLGDRRGAAAHARTAQAAGVALKLLRLGGDWVNRHRIKACQYLHPSAPLRGAIVRVCRAQDFKSSGAARGSLPHAQALRRPQPATALRADVRADRPAAHL